MRKRNWITVRLDSWGWHQAAKELRKGEEQPIRCSISVDCVGGTPGHKILMREQDWMRPDVLNTQLCYEKLNDKQRAVVWAHYVHPEVPAKVNAEKFGVTMQAYYRMLERCHKIVGHYMENGVEVENGNLRKGSEAA